MESETFVQPPCAVSDADVQRYWSTEAGCLSEHLLEKPAANAFPASFRCQGDVDHAHVVRRVVDVETSDRPAVEDDDQKRRAGVVAAIVGALQVELHPQEGVGLLPTPSNRPELVDARAGVQRPEERLVVAPFLTKDQFLDGNTPMRAMQKFSGRFGCMLLCG